jgi:hypothetical protein
MVPCHVDRTPTIFDAIGRLGTADVALEPLLHRSEPDEVALRFFEGRQTIR